LFTFVRFGRLPFGRKYKDYNGKDIINMQIIATPAAEKLRNLQERYRVEANLNLYAVIEFEIFAENEADADRRAAELIDECEPIISVAILGSDFVEVSLHPENVEPGLLNIWKV
jgi:hypothetical protein